MNNSKYLHMKESILKQNRDHYSEIRSQRQMCLEEKYNIIQQNTIRMQEKFNRYKSQEIRLKNMYNTLKSDRLNKNKSRYDDQTLKNS